MTPFLLIVLGLWLLGLLVTIYKLEERCDDSSSILFWSVIWPITWVCIFLEGGDEE